jgi:hypothetical protein
MNVRLSDQPLAREGAEKEGKQSARDPRGIAA